MKLIKPKDRKIEFIKNEIEFGNLLIPQLIDYDNEKIVVETDTWKKIEKKFHDPEINWYSTLLQGIFEDWKGRVIEFRSGHNYQINCFNREGTNIGRFYSNPYFNEIESRRTEPDYRRAGIAGYAFEKHERDFKQNRKQQIIIRTNEKAENIVEFLSSRKYKKNIENTSYDGIAEYIKPLDFKTDETDNLEQYAAFPIEISGEVKCFSVKIFE